MVTDLSLEQLHANDGEKVVEHLCTGMSISDLTKQSICHHGQWINELWIKYNEHASVLIFLLLFFHHTAHSAGMLNMQSMRICVQ